MAVSLQFSQFAGLGRAPGQRGQCVEMPPVRVDRSGEGTLPLVKGATLFGLRNFGDPCLVRVQSAESNLQAADTDPQSYALGTGDTLEFMLPDRTKAFDWELDVRALS